MPISSMIIAFVPLSMLWLRWGNTFCIGYISNICSQVKNVFLKKPFALGLIAAKQIQRLVEYDINSSNGVHCQLGIHYVDVESL